VDIKLYRKTNDNFTDLQITATSVKTLHCVTENLNNAKQFKGRVPCPPTSATVYRGNYIPKLYANEGYVPFV